MQSEGVGIADDTAQDLPEATEQRTKAPHVPPSDGASAWAWSITIGGLLLMLASIVPSMAAHPGAPVVLGDAEVVPVFGMILFVLGALVLLQRWSGLT